MRKLRAHLLLRGVFDERGAHGTPMRKGRGAGFCYCGRVPPACRAACRIGEFPCDRSAACAWITLFRDFLRAFWRVLSPRPATTQQPGGAAHATTAAEAPNRDSSYIDAQGTAHVTRVVPVPQTISPEAQIALGRPELDQAPPQSLEERRKMTDEYTARAREAWSNICPNQIVDEAMAGVPVRVVTPEGLPASNKDKVLLNLHGGGFNSDSGSYTESIPIASYAKTKVVAVLYRLAPEHPFPAGVDDSIAVYKELLKSYRPNHIVIYGTSAGAILTAEVAAKLQQLGLPLPAALGIFSGMGDFARAGDSQSMFALRGLSGHLDPPQAGVHDS